MKHVVALVNWGYASPNFFQSLKCRGIDLACFICHHQETWDICRKTYPQCLTVDLMKHFMHHHKNSAYLKELLRIEAEPWGVKKSKTLDNNFWFFWV